MSERKHTPGPWEVVDPGPKQLLRIHFYDVDADDDGRARDYGHDICEMADVADDWENAHLIAAAPDMHAALSAVHAWLGRWAVHAGRCEGGVRCTCGLLAITTEAEIALIKAQGVTDPLQEEHT